MISRQTLIHTKRLGSFNRPAHGVCLIGCIAGLSIGCTATISSAQEEPTLSSTADPDPLPLSFTNEALARGINFRMGFNFHQIGAGNMLVDIDNDGDLDIFLAGGQNGAVGVFENDGTGNFTDRTATSGIVAEINASGYSAADYDNDGDLDIHVPGWFVPSKLYRNNGDMTFTDVAAQAGVDIVAPSLAAAWGDYDQDGWLDLYACVRTFTDGVEIQNRLYHNNGDGTFTDVATDLGVEAPGDPSCLPAFFDYDRDGDADIYIGTDKGSIAPPMLHNKLYRNNGDGTFYNATYDADAEAYIFCMGIAVGDINFDGYFDLYLTNITQGNLLYTFNSDTGAYVDRTAEAGMESNYVGWGTVFADFDNDGYLDTYVCNTQFPNRLYRGSPDWPLVDEAPAAGVDVFWDNYCVSVGDVDGDNDLDMLVGNTNRRINLFINNSPDLAIHNWARFDLRGGQDNEFCVGACVEVDAGGVTQLREVRSGVNYKAQDELTLHFGLGNATSIQEVRASFPGGATRVLTNTPINGNWMIFEPERLGDMNNDGLVSLDELAHAVAARTGPGGKLSPGDEIFDMDGDFDIDFHDIAQLGLLVRDPSAK